MSHDFDQDLVQWGISVDVETAGPHVDKYSLLSIGACLIRDPTTRFYVELKPDKLNFVPEAMAVTGLNLETLTSSGTEPRQALQMFADWSRTKVRRSNIFYVAYNAAFDWMFTDYYGSVNNVSMPFGYCPVCCKSRFGLMDKNKYPLPHKADDDAVIQAHFIRDSLGIK